MSTFFPISEATSAEPIENGIVTRCQLGEDGLGRFRIQAISERSLLVELSVRSGLDERVPNGIPINSQRDFVVENTISKDALSVATSQYVATVSRRPFAFDVKRNDSERSIVQSVDDDFTTWGVPLNRSWGAVAEGSGQQLFKRVESVHMTTLMRHDEKFYGLGEQFRSFQHRGQRIVMRNENGQGTRATAYKNVPFFWSNYGYGVLVDSYLPSVIDLGQTSNRSLSIIHPGPVIRLVLMFGESPSIILEEYTSLTGRVPTVPVWSLGLWVSTYFDETDSSRVLAQTERYRELDIPVDVYHFDTYWLRTGYWNDFTWDATRFDDPELLIKKLKDKDFKVCLWINPYVSVLSELFSEGDEKGYFLKNSDGNTYLAATWRPGRVPLTGIVDFTNPDALEWWFGLLRGALAQDVDVFKSDFGEAVPLDAVAFDGTRGEELRNQFARLYNESVFKVTHETNGNALVWARTAWAGTQQYPTHWGGDPHTTWEDMASSLRGGLNFSLSGFAYWSHDIGGFRGTPTTELYIRWSQLGTLSPHARLHGTTNRDPWNFSEPATTNLRAFARFRYSILPYLEHLGVIARNSGAPLMRPLVFTYPDDPAVSEIDTEYLLGDSLLVVPTLSEGGKTDYYLPNGQWFELGNGKVYSGSRFYSENVPLTEMRLFLKQGEPLLRTNVGTTTDDAMSEALVVELFPGSKQSTSDVFAIRGGNTFNVKTEANGEVLSITSSHQMKGLRIRFLIHEFDGDVVINGIKAEPSTISDETMNTYALFTREGVLYEVPL